MSVWKQLYMIPYYDSFVHVPHTEATKVPHKHNTVPFLVVWAGRDHVAHDANCRTAELQYLIITDTCPTVPQT